VCRSAVNRRVLLLAAMGCFIGPVVFGRTSVVQEQTSAAVAKLPVFGVVSVKPSKSGAMGEGLGSHPSRWGCEGWGTRASEVGRSGSLRYAAG
jgi:hypothetical protein